MGIFENVRLEDVRTATGQQTLPILYRDASLAGAFFLAERERAAALLADAALEPWTLFGRALVFLFAWEYRDTSIGPYREVGLGFQVRRPGSRPSALGLLRDMRAQPEQGTWVANLPVTSEVARRAGVEVWGYPKYTTPIETSITRARVHVRLGSELTLSLGSERGPERATLPIACYTRKDDRLLRTVIEVAGTSTWGVSGEVTLHGDGPTAASFERLGLVGKRPIATFRTHDFTAVLPRGTDMGPASAASRFSSG